MALSGKFAPGSIGSALDLTGGILDDGGIGLIANLTPPRQAIYWWKSWAR